MCVVAWRRWVDVGSPSSAAALRSRLHHQPPLHPCDRLPRRVPVRLCCGACSCPRFRGHEQVWVPVDQPRRRPCFRAPLRVLVRAHTRQRQHTRMHGPAPHASHAHSCHHQLQPTPRHRGPLLLTCLTAGVRRVCVCVLRCASYPAFRYVSLRDVVLVGPSRGARLPTHRHHYSCAGVCRSTCNTTST